MTMGLKIKEILEKLEKEQERIAKEAERHRSASAPVLEYVYSKLMERFRGKDSEDKERRFP